MYTEDIMNKILTVVVLAVVLAGCSSLDTSSFSSVTGKEWKLIEVRIDSPIRREILFDRSALSKENAGTFFTLKFDNDHVSGVAAPNRYNGPYTLGEEEKSITISTLRTTMMAATIDPTKYVFRLKEHDYYQYIHNVYKWDLVNGRLILHSRNEAGQEVHMLFS